MASFDCTEDRELVKYSLKRVEPIVRRIIKVLHIDLGRLCKHKRNIERLRESGDLTQLNKEQVNANTTVQQINSTLKQLECTRSQIDDADLASFDRQVRDIYQEAITSVEVFLSFRDNSTHGNAGREPLSELKPSSLPNQHYLPDTPHTSSASEDVAHSLPQPPLRLEQQLLVQPDESMDETSEESWQALEGSLHELNSLIHDYAVVLETQQEKVDHIEDNIEDARENVQQGTISLGTAAKLKATLLPVAGAIMGGALGGPVGLVVGLKLGGLAAVGGGIIGFTGGSLLKKRQQRIADMEMQNLSHGSSQSLPELHRDEQSLPEFHRDEESTTSTGRSRIRSDDKDNNTSTGRSRISSDSVT